MRRITASSQHSLIVGGRRSVSAICTGLDHMVKNGGADPRRGGGGPSPHPRGPETLRIVLAVLTLVAILTVCESSGVAAAQSPPPIDLPDLHGKSVTLAEYRGVSPVLLVFYRGHW
ncbi:MAG: hypothetical protein ACLQPD_30235 [Desulfomonilaceae bacterium]